MNHSAQRRVGVIALAISTVLFTGCTSPSSASPAESTTPSASKSAASPTPEPSATPSTSASAVPSDLSFEAGSDLDGGTWNIGWGDNFANSPGFTVASEDNGNGFYSYLDTTTSCKLFFFQGTVSDLDMTHDDRTISDDFLVTMLTQTVEGATREDVSSHAYDDTVAQYPGPGTASTRTIWGRSSDGGSWLHSARMFGAIGGGVYVGITCPAGQDASAELSTLVHQHLALMAAPAA